MPRGRFLFIGLPRDDLVGGTNFIIVHVSVYRRKTPNGSRHSTLLFLYGTLLQQICRDQRALIPCSFSLRVTLSDPWRQ